MSGLCERPGCSQPGAVAYGMVPEELTFWLDHPDPNAPMGSLCSRHADSMTVPRGWTLDDRRQPDLLLFRVRTATAETPTAATGTPASKSTRRRSSAAAPSSAPAPTPAEAAPAVASTAAAGDLPSPSPASPSPASRAPASSPSSPASPASSGRRSRSKPSVAGQQLQIDGTGEIDRPTDQIDLFDADAEPTVPSANLDTVSPTGLPAPTPPAAAPPTSTPQAPADAPVPLVEPDRFSAPSLFSPPEPPTATPGESTDNPPGAQPGEAPTAVVAHTLFAPSDSAATPPSATPDPSDDAPTSASASSDHARAEDRDEVVDDDYVPADYYAQHDIGLDEYDEYDDYDEGYAVELRWADDQDGRETIDESTPESGQLPLVAPTDPLPNPTPDHDEVATGERPASNPGASDPGATDADDETPLASWRPIFDHDDDLDGVLDVTTPLLRRAFRGESRS